MTVFLFCLLAFAGTDDVVERYQAHVQFLADDLLEGRETSFRGQRLASRYLASQLALAGADPAFPDSDEPYYQTFQVHVRGIDQASVTASLKSRGQTMPLIANQDFQMRTLGVGDFNKTGPLVFAGYGMEEDAFDEYADLKVKDRWVVVLEGQPEGEAGSIFEKSLPGSSLFRKVMMARRKEALGIILLRNQALQARSGAGPGHRFSLVDSKKEPRKPTPAFPMISVPKEGWAKILGRDFDKFEKRVALIAETQTPQSFTLRRAEFSLKFDAKEEIRDTENVVAILPGSDPVLKKEHVVISAHFDHVGIQNGTVYNGADDNATGSATLLMLARDLAKMKHKRSLMILLVSAEESGLLGSSYFIDHPPLPVEQLVANINMDMIGRHKTGEIGVIPSAVEGISTLNQLLDEVNASSPFQHTLIKDMDRYHKRSDHYNFTKNDIPALFFFAGVHDDYHGPDDDWQKLNYEKLERLYGLMREFLLRTLDMPQRPVFLEVPEESEETSETP